MNTIISDVKAGAKLNQLDQLKKFTTKNIRPQAIQKANDMHELKYKR